MVVVFVVSQALATLYCMQMRYVNCYVDYGESTGENKDEGMSINGSQLRSSEYYRRTTINQEDDVCLLIFS